MIGASTAQCMHAAKHCKIFQYPVKPNWRTKMMSKDAPCNRKIISHFTQCRPRQLLKICLYPLATMEPAIMFCTLRRPAKRTKLKLNRESSVPLQITPKRLTQYLFWRLDYPVAWLSRTQNNPIILSVEMETYHTYTFRQQARRFALRSAWYAFPKNIELKKRSRIIHRNYAEFYGDVATVET